jgi:hypothetical protein
MRKKREPAKLSPLKIELLDELKEYAIREYGSIREISRVTEIHNGNLSRLFKHYHGMGIDELFSTLEKLNLKLVIEDQDAEWGENMARLRMMPKKLYTAERIEAREIIQKQGFYPRVDLFDNVETALKFAVKPCDLYEIRLGRLIRKKFDVQDHPFGTMYSYHDIIPVEAIVNKATHR